MAMTYLLKRKIMIFLLIFTIVGIVHFNFVVNENIPKSAYEELCDSICLTDNVTTVREGGRLGNCVWEYISVLGLGESLSLCPYVPRGILDCLGKVFKNLTIPAYEDTLLSDRCREIRGGNAESCKSLDLFQNGTDWDRLCYTLNNNDTIGIGIARKPVTELKKLKESGQLPSILILPLWWDYPHVFGTVGIKRFQQELQFRDDVKQLAEATLNGVRKKSETGDLTFVGVHVRRTDFHRHLKILHGENVSFADVDYYERAMTRMHELYDLSSMVFVVVGDDYEWCKNNLVNETEGVFWGGLENSTFIKNWEEKRDMAVGHDLAVLSMQNHTIIGYGTYAVTGSLLSGGHTIVNNVSRHSQVTDEFSTHLSNILPNWEQL